MNKLNSRVSILLIFMILLSSLLINTTFADSDNIEETESSTSVLYTITIASDYFTVEGELRDVNEDSILLTFEDNYAGISNLSNCISSIHASNDKVSSLPVTQDNNQYLIHTGDSRDVHFSYKYLPSAVQHDYHLATLTDTFLHIPGYPFFPEISDSEENSVLPDYSLKVKIVGIPEGWQDARNLPVDDEGYTQLESMYDTMIDYGKYSVFSFPLNQSMFTVATDDALAFDATTLQKDIQLILKRHLEIYGNAPEPNMSMVINQKRNLMPGITSLGGYVEKGYILNEIGGITQTTFPVQKTLLLGHLVHESHHLWISNGFEIKDNWSWFWEGTAEYQKLSILKDLNLIGNFEFDTLRYVPYLNYKNHPSKSEISLYEISTGAGDFSVYSDLLYDKGAVVANLLDNALIERGSSLNKLLQSLYQSYAVAGVPLGNDELIREIDNALGSSIFTENYILGTADISMDIPMHIQVYAALKRYMPPFAFPWDIITVLIVLLALSILFYALWRTTRPLRRKFQVFVSTKTSQSTS